MCMSPYVCIYLYVYTRVHGRVHASLPASSYELLDIRSLPGVGLCIGVLRRGSG